MHPKADAQVLGVDPALEYPNVALLTNAYVEKLETSAYGCETTRVVVRRNGAREEFSAAVVASAAGAINSAALLFALGAFLATSVSPTANAEAIHKTGQFHGPKANTGMAMHAS